MPLKYVKKSLENVTIGIDPGTQYTGYAIVGYQNHRFVRLVSGVWPLHRHAREEEKLYVAQTNVEALLKTHTCQSMVMEAAFQGKNVQSMLKLGRLQGVLMATAEKEQVSLHSYAPRTIKQAVGGHGNATKEVVAHRVWLLLEETVDNHTWDESDALATAICHILRTT